MSCNFRKRQRPSARDFFDAAPAAPSLASSVENDEGGPVGPSRCQPADPPPGVGTQNDAESETRQVLADLRGLDPVQATSVLIRGGMRLSVDEHAKSKQVYVLRAADHRQAVPVRLPEIVRFHHIAKILWGPGRREINHAQSISLGQVGVGEHTAEVYMIGFVSSDAAYKAASPMAYLLNQFLVAHKQPLSVEVQVGSKRWWIESGKPLTEAQWHIERRSIPRGVPMPKPIIQTHKSVLQAPQRVFEVSQLPKWFTAEMMLKSLIGFGLPNLPIEIKFTKESGGEKPVRILVRFGDLPSSIISKFRLSVDGIKVEEEEGVDSKASQSMVTCLVDEGDSSIDDPWQIWTDPLIWPTDKIKEYVVGIRERSENTVEINYEDEPDELESEGTIQGDAESEDGAGVDGDNNFARQPQPVLGIVEQRKLRLAELEQMIAELSVECQAGFQDFQQRQRPNSAMYNAADQASYECKMAKLSELSRKKKILRRQAKKYKQRKATSASVKRLRKDWRRQQQRRIGERVSADAQSDESDQASSAEVESSESSEQEDHAHMSKAQWERSRQKRRCREIMHPRHNESDNDDEAHPKRIWMHDELYRRKHARPNEPEPREVD